MRKLIAGLAVGAATIVATAGPALADPAGPHARTLDATCALAGAVTVTTLDNNGQWTPAWAQSSTRVAVTVGFHISGTFTPSDGSPAQSFTEDVAKKGPVRAPVDSCAFTQSFTDENGTVELDGIAYVVWR